MATNFQIDVISLDASHRRAFEELIGFPLETNQRLTISVSEINAPSGDQKRPMQSLDDWIKIYDGLSIDEIDAIDRIAKTRADFARDTN